MKTKLFLLLFAILLSTFSFGDNYLRINNPQTWSQYNALIDEAELTVRPVGAFVEYGLTLTVSGWQPIPENDNTQLEIVLDFDLPSNSIITDSWLWIDGKPKQSEILDRWTASAIYEEIVNRRKDPSLLVKNGANQYRINIYPMKTKESRKFKMVYLSPAKYANNRLIIDFPSNILNLSSVPLSNTSVYFLPSEFYNNPTSENSAVTFSNVNHVEYGNCIKADVSNSAFNSAKIQLESTNTEKVKLYKYGTNNEGYYQLSFVPSDLIERTETPKPICFLIDYDPSYSNINIDETLSQLANYFETSMSENDYFNVLFSYLSPKPFFSDWVTATNENIQKGFAENTLSPYSNTVPLLAAGLEFINQHNGSGEIVLISNNCNFNPIESANGILSDIAKLNSHKNKISIIDYALGHYTRYWTSSKYYSNNSYLFSNLARTTSGEYIQFLPEWNGSNFYSLMEEAVSEITGEVLNNIDIYTDNDNGFCYGRLNVAGALSNSYKFQKAIHQVGKFKGGFPTTLEIAFEMNDQLYHSKLNLDQFPVIEGDSVIKTIWSGLDMIDLEKQGNSNQVINEIIYQSIDNRILSYYTAFLCVEDSVEICKDCGEVNIENPNDGGGVAISVDEKKTTEQVKAYPNPFTTSIQLDLPSKEKLTGLKIYNATGQCVKTFIVEKDKSAYVWDGIADDGDDEKAGIYLVVASYANKVITTKILKK